jgi:hypothetical protein
MMPHGHVRERQPGGRVAANPALKDGVCAAITDQEAKRSGVIRSDRLMLAAQGLVERVHG